MPAFQNLAEKGHLEAHEIDVKKAVQKMYQEEYNVSSHKWNDEFHPDRDGTQLQAIQYEAQKNPNLKWFWIDYPCLPQEIKDADGKVAREKSDLEHRYFQKTLPCVSILYLNMDIFILADVDYIDRFWLLFESYLATHKASANGLVVLHPIRKRPENFVTVHGL